LKDAPKNRIPQKLADDFVATQKQGTRVGRSAGWSGDANETARRANVAGELRRRNLPGDANAAHWIDYYNGLRNQDGSWSV